MFKLIKKISINPIPSSSSQTLEDVLPESFKSKDIPSYLRNLRKVSKPTDISDYQLIKILGVGSYGTVWLSKSKINQQVYALKVVEKTRMKNARDQQSLATESKIMLKLRKKPFILQLYESFSNHRYVFMVLDLAELGDLNGLIKKVGRMSREVAAYYIVQIAGGLDGLHKAQIIYRDLKPENVLLTHHGRVRLADFGLSKDLSTLKGRTQTFCGTLIYVAPEVILGEPYDYAIDWYALGLLAHELYMGTIPLADGKLPVLPSELMQVIVSGKIKPDSSLHIECRHFINWLSSFHPARRPKNLEALRIHPWISESPWEDILSDQSEAPFQLSHTDRVYPQNIDPLVDHSSEYHPHTQPDQRIGSSFLGF